MVQDAVDQQQMIAVCHTRKEISAAKTGQTVQDALKSNQATYEPQEIFSAGYCEILETTSDGRAYVVVNIEKRLRFVKEIQTLPYRIAACEEVEDELCDADSLVNCQRDIVSTLLTLIGKQNPAQLATFDSEEWLQKAPAEFSFSVFQLLRFDSDTMQDILEMTHPLERLETIQSVLTRSLEATDR